jgi:urease accessory protein
MSSDIVDSSQSHAIQDEIAELEERLEKAKARLSHFQGAVSTLPSKVPGGDGTKSFLCARFLADFDQDL